MDLVVRRGPEAEVPRLAQCIGDRGLGGRRDPARRGLGGVAEGRRATGPLGRFWSGEALETGRRGVGVKAARRESCKRRGTRLSQLADLVCAVLVTRAHLTHHRKVARL